MLSLPDQLILDQIPGYIGWKDKNFKYLGCNARLLSSMKLPHRDELIGRDDEELGLNPPEMNSLFAQQDTLALTGNTIEVIHESVDPKDNRAYFLQKTPLRDGQSEIIGVIYHCMPWPQGDFIAALKKIDQKYQPATEGPEYYAVDTNHNSARLSSRELECLFLQLRGKTAKQIGEILRLSKRTIEYYTDNIKNKLGCQNKSELLVTAMTQGYHRHVPKSILELNLPEIL